MVFGVCGLLTAVCLSFAWCMVFVVCFVFVGGLFVCLLVSVCVCVCLFVCLFVRSCACVCCVSFVGFCVLLD